MINDRSERARHELDVVANTRLESGATPVAAIGEAKHTIRQRTPGDLARLERIRELLIARRSAEPRTKLLLFSANGFDRDLMDSTSERSDVELIDIDRLYRGD